MRAGRIPGIQESSAAKKSDVCQNGGPGVRQELLSHKMQSHSHMPPSQAQQRDGHSGGVGASRCRKGLPGKPVAQGGRPGPLGAIPSRGDDPETRRPPPTGREREKLHLHQR